MKLRFIAQIPNDHNKNSYTYYFFSPRSGILLPIKVDIPASNVNNIISIFLKALKIFSIKILGIIIYLYKEGEFLCYLSFYSNKNRYEINCRIEDSLVLLEGTDLPVYIKKELLAKMGIKVTKRMILKALEEDFYLK